MRYVWFIIRNDSLHNLFIREIYVGTFGSFDGFHFLALRLRQWILYKSWRTLPWESRWPLGPQPAAFSPPNRSQASSFPLSTKTLFISVPWERLTQSTSPNGVISFSILRTSVDLLELMTDICLVVGLTN